MNEQTTYSIVVSERAENNLDQIIEYLLQEWSEKVKDEFLEKLQKTLNLLSINPFLFREYSKKKKIRKCLVSTQNALYYRIVKNKIEIITIHDTRRNPKSIKL